ncbi:Uu.00g100650.m01.CDS01 [Anthostomella pinea]|uniref:Uu.00g100650.m01.CDS01 n=1 Tax=Anthostomella pinea TaxID=933095 RepID=A0AAI8VCZ6_9PEZI|nr:Uu.00g100650.m01.CDS01 [Anthostomella pinea]
MHPIHIIALIATGLSARAAPVVEPCEALTYDKVVGFEEAGSSLAKGQDQYAPIGRGCDESTGQVYARGATHGDHYAIMYSWTLQRSGWAIATIGRTPWPIVWIDNAFAAEPKMVGLSTSAHGKIATITSDFLVDGTRPRIRYYNTFPLNHQLGTADEDDKVGKEQPLIEWGNLTDASRTTLQDTDFGDATVPFKDSTFEGHLAQVTL